MAVLSYDQYARLSEGDIASMQASYNRLGRAHKRIGYELGYTKKLERLRAAVQANARVTADIAGLARDEFRGPGDVRGDLGRVRESLKHFVRDWSDEGVSERSRIFGPILEVLKGVDAMGRGSMRVLVPGAGLGRLAWEISQLGFDTTANELSSFMNVAFRFLLSERTTWRPDQHAVQPYASWFSHQRTADALFRSVSMRFPVLPRAPPAVPDASDAPGYDYVVTLFFIDTSLNVIETVEHIHALLKPGGQWINLGPLLWTSGGQAAVELSLEEVLQLVRTTGFRVAGDEGGERNALTRRTVECEYTADKTAMMKWLYQAEFWVATKA
ncbi:N2227-domain-containing protein [Amylocystis lapponica]|nr:N2227-domain-containing protein [Amylocystis lapponica]